MSEILEAGLAWLAFVRPAYAQTGAGGGGVEEFLIGILPFVAIFAIIYFLILRPQQKKVREHREMVAAVRRGDVVVTGGGLIGKVHRVVDDHECIVELCEDVRVRVLKATLSDVRSKTEPVSGGDGEDDSGGGNGSGGKRGKGKEKN